MLLLRQSITPDKLYGVTIQIKPTFSSSAPVKGG